MNQLKKWWNPEPSKIQKDIQQIEDTSNLNKFIRALDKFDEAIKKLEQEVKDNGERVGGKGED